MIDPDRPCPHLKFAVSATVNRITECENDPVPVGYFADIDVHCDDCGEPFRWTGVPAGMSPRFPTCSVDQATLCAPLRPASADPDFGMGLPGFTIRVVEHP